MGAARSMKSSGAICSFGPDPSRVWNWSQSERLYPEAKRDRNEVTKAPFDRRWGGFRDGYLQSRLEYLEAGYDKGPRAKAR